MVTRITAPLIVAATLLPLPTLAGSLISGDAQVASRVVKATVYTDRAMVTREAKVEVTSGLQHITLVGLPPLLQDQSVRVSATGSAEAKILEVKVDRVFLDTVSSTRIVPILQTRKSLNNDLRVLNDRLGIISHQRDFLNKIAIASQESIARELRTQRPTTEDWGKILDFFDDKISKYNEETRGLEDRRILVQEKIQALEREIQAAGGSPEKGEKAITIAFDVQRDGSLVLETSYLISQAGWTPTYDIRASSADTNVELTYSALVRQNTGEDWKNVHMTLSTSLPALGGAPPELQPWFVGAAEREQGFVEGSVRDAATGEPLIGANILLVGSNTGAATDVNGYYRINNVPPGWQTFKSSYVGYQAVNLRVNVRPFVSTRADFSLTAEGVVVATVEIAAQAPVAKEAPRNVAEMRSPSTVAPGAPPVASKTAEVMESLISAAFPITGECTVPSDNAEHRVTVIVAQLGGSFSHIAVPKLQADAFFKAALHNSTEYPILPGPMSAYVDNAFVSRSKLTAVMPGEKFDAFLGADNGVHIERKLLNRVTDISGLFSKTRKIRYEVLITADNRKTTPQTLLLKENVPVSQDERVKVEITLPRPDEATPDASGIITWQIQLAPGENREFRLQYSIEAPSDLSVGGLE
ncbi:MAG TPA: mucoidy inhibitor MuiA family protein [Bacteroidota bacterium]|nr:mucoidy inhibitor MuiA family protein [Bacteroidota bacterium]